MLGAPLPRHRTSVIIGAGGGVADLGQRYALAPAGFPNGYGHYSPPSFNQLPEWTRDRFQGSWSTWSQAV